MIIRKATEKDLPAITALFTEVHDAEARGDVTTGWLREIYPISATAVDALNRCDLFVEEDGNEIVGTAIINHQQVDVYSQGHWSLQATDEELLILHTLVISMSKSHCGYGKNFVNFYEDYARTLGCKALRIDTNERNKNARLLYKGLGFSEVDIIPCTFNGIEGVNLVLLEKVL